MPHPSLITDWLMHFPSVEVVSRLFSYRMTVKNAPTQSDNQLAGGICLPSKRRGAYFSIKWRLGNAPALVENQLVGSFVYRIIAEALAFL